MTDHPAPVRRSNSLLRPHVAEWFGHRVFPTVSQHPVAGRDQRSGTCPFLTDVAGRRYSCIKRENSRGVCTISAGSNKTRQDWLVCPHRAFNREILTKMVRRLFDVDDEEDVTITPTSELQASGDTRSAIAKNVADPQAPRQFVIFQQYFGGEIGLSKTPLNPELSFDATVVELLPAQQLLPGASGIELGRYGVIELQTTDTHGSYKHAVKALSDAQDLFPDPAFAQRLAENPEWSGRKVEGPNISNVFKRTFYQIMFKFQITRRETSAGCILALPQPVWDSWQPFLGAPHLYEMTDGTKRLLGKGETPEDDDVVAGRRPQPPNWLYIFDIEENPPLDGSPARVEVRDVIGTDAQSLSRLALDVSPARAAGVGTDVDLVMESLRRRMRQFVPGLVD